MTGARRVWVVSDGVPGHEARSRGVLAALARLGPVVAVPVPGRLRNRLCRGVMIAAMAGGRRAPGWLLRLCHEVTLPEGRPDLVLGAGGQTQFLTLALAEAHGVPSIFCALPRHVDAARFTVVPVPYPLPGVPGAVELEVPLSDIEPDRVRAAGAALREKAEDAPVWLLLLGGDGGGFRFDPGEWRTIGAGAARLAAAAGARLLVATSRRTGATVEAALRDGLGPAALLGAYWWGEGARGALPALLGAADLVLVTADSASMTGEAVAAGRPVLALEPASARPAARHRELFARLAVRGRIRVLSVTELGTLAPPDPASFRPLEVPPVEFLAAELARRLRG